MAEETEVKVEWDSNDRVQQVSGVADEFLHAIEKRFAVQIRARGNRMILTGSQAGVACARKVLEDLTRLSERQPVLSWQDVRSALQLASMDGQPGLSQLRDDVILTTARGRAIVPRTVGQKAYVDAIRTNNLVFGIGPAGTGKTYLAVAMAVGALRRKEVARLVLTRPAVEAGEKLGFLPGDLQDKVDPYLRPLYDALYDTLGMDGFHRYMERGLIEVAPLAYMRGRTLDDAFIILDEAQNTTPEQMKMFLTRMGFGSKVVVTGDITQVDLPKDQESGLLQVQQVLKGVEGIAFVYLDEQDVVRHELVQSIIRAYDRFDRWHRNAGAVAPAPAQAGTQPPVASAQGR
ncbi:MAG: PhoH family protein [Limnochordaceae bacterium]|nr:PhoH family protein [Limnochordaceae bacterium]